MSGIDDARTRKDVVEGFCNETTMHGLKYFFVRGLIRKIIWAVLVVSGFGLVCFQVRQQFIYFLERPISTSVDLQFPTTLPFPSVMICNSNMFRIQKAYGEDVYHLFTYAYNSSISKSEKRQVLQDANGQYTQALTKVKSTYGNNMDQFFDNYGHKLEDMLLSCVNVDGTLCNVTHFSSLLTELGKCYIFNIDGSANVSKAGPTNSLTIYVNLAAYESMTGLSEQSSLKVMIHGSNERQSISEKGIDVPPGYMSVIGTTYHTEERLCEEYGGSCVDNYATVHYSSDQYNAITCQLDKDFNFMEAQCKCTPHHAPTIANSTKCTVDNYFSCILQIDNTEMQQIQNCKETCSSKTYKTSLSLAKIPANVMNKLITLQQQTKITGEYQDAMEAFSRTDPKEFGKMDRFLTAIKKYNGQAAAMGLLPNLDVSKSPAERLSEYSVKYKSYSTIFASIMKSATSGYGVGPRSVPITNTNLMNAFAKVVPNEQQNVFNASNNYDNNANLTVGIFNGFANWSELVKNPTSSNVLAPAEKKPSIYFYYNLLLRMLDDYIQKRTTKLKLTQVSEFQTVAASFDSNVCDELESLNTFGQAIDVFMNHSITKMAFQHLNESPETSSFWIAMNYALTAQLKINLDPSCSPDQFSNNFDLSPSSIEVGVNCTIPIGSYYRDFFRFWLDNQATITNETKLAFKSLRVDICLNIKQSFEKLYTHLYWYQNQFVMDDTFYSKNILGVKIFFSELSIEAVSQSQAYDLFSFICDIGGSLGLFLGASILTFFEVIDMIICGFIFNDRKKHKIDNVQK